MTVSAASTNPKKAFRRMKEIETATFEHLEEEEGMEVLWQKLLCELQKTLEGQFLKGLLLADEKLAKEKPPMTGNGRQLARMVRRKFGVAETQQNIFTGREIHVLQLQKDNVPGYLIELDALLLEIGIDKTTLEVLFSTQMEKHEQLTRIMHDYNYGIQRGTCPRTYEYFAKKLIYIFQFPRH